MFQKIFSDFLHKQCLHAVKQFSLLTFVLIQYYIWLSKITLGKNYSFISKSWFVNFVYLVMRNIIFIFIEKNSFPFNVSWKKFSHCIFYRRSKWIIYFKKMGIYEVNFKSGMHNLFKIRGQKKKKEYVVGQSSA